MERSHGCPALDPLLQPLLDAADEEERRELQAQIVSAHAQPVIRSIIRRRFGSSLRGSPQDVDDIEADVLVSLLGRLEALSARPDTSAIANLRGYVAVMAYHACDQHLRARHPERWRLKCRIRYALTHCDRLALWEGAGGQWMAGLPAWRGRTPVLVSSERLNHLKSDPAGAGPAGLAAPGIADQLHSLFLWLGHPLELDDLVDVVRRLFRTHEPGDALPPPADLDLEQEPERGTSPETTLERRLYLERLWGEIRALPPRQRVALLMNLRDAEGHDILGLLTLVGITCLRGIAEALDVGAPELAELWSQLPLEDAVLARRLGITRQQVINLRKSARERLARRMKVAGFGSL